MFSHPIKIQKCGHQPESDCCFSGDNFKAGDYFNSLCGDDKSVLSKNKILTIAAGK